MSLSTVTAAIVTAQRNATIQVILPLLTNPDTIYSVEAVAEWQMFKPLAATFAQQFNPATAYSEPLQFVNWLFAHPEISGSKQYQNHLTTLADQKSSDQTTQLLDIPFLLDAETTLYQHGIPMPGHEIAP